MSRSGKIIPKRISQALLEEKIPGAVHTSVAPHRVNYSQILDRGGGEKIRIRADITPNSTRGVGNEALFTGDLLIAGLKETGVPHSYGDSLTFRTDNTVSDVIHMIKSDQPPFKGNRNDTVVTDFQGASLAELLGQTVKLSGNDGVDIAQVVEKAATESQGLDKVETYNEASGILAVSEDSLPTFDRGSGRSLRHKKKLNEVPVYGLRRLDYLIGRAPYDRFRFDSDAEPGLVAAAVQDLTTTSLALGPLGWLTYAIKQYNGSNPPGYFISESLF